MRSRYHGTDDGGWLLDTPVLSIANSFGAAHVGGTLNVTTGSTKSRWTPACSRLVSHVSVVGLTTTVPNCGVALQSQAENNAMSGSSHSCWSARAVSGVG